MSTPMPRSHDTATPNTPHHPDPKRTALAGALTGLGIFAAHLWMVERTKAAYAVSTAGRSIPGDAFMHGVSERIGPDGWAALPFALLTGWALALVLRLAWARRTHWRKTLRPRRPVWFGTLALALLTPFAIVSYAPWILGILVAGILVEEPQSALLPVAALMAAVLVWYPVAGVLVSSLRSRWRRFGAFALVWAGTASALVLIVGNRPFLL